MRRLAYLLLPLGIACSAPNPLSGYPGEYAQQQGQGGQQQGTASPEDAGAPPGQANQGGGSTPSPLSHNDAGSWWQPDAQSAPPVAAPPADDGGSTPPPASDDAGGSAAPDSAPSSGDDAGNANAALLAACVGGINAFRGQNDLFQYTVSTELEAFAAQAAASDAQSGQQDGYFNETGGNNVSFAEDEFDGQQIDPGATATQVLTQGLADEENGEINGDGNLLSQQFSQVGCGVAQASDGSYWIAIEYR
jgi:uncharacterized protein YkwD